MEDSWLAIAIGVPAAIVVVIGLLAGLRVGRGTARTPLDLGIDGLRLGQEVTAGAIAAIGQVMAAQDLEVDQVAKILQQAGGMREGHALHRVLIDGQQLVADMNLAILVGDASYYREIRD